MKVIMSGGGTGGHIYPAIAIADTIRNNFPDSEIIFTGNATGPECRITQEAGYEFRAIECKGFSRSLSPKNIKAAFLSLTSPRKGKKLIKEFKPDVVIGTGGYVCWPTVKAASDLGIPSVLHESNSVPGLAVKMLSKNVGLILTNYEDTIGLIGYPEKSVRVGNPLRSTFTTVNRDKARFKVGAGKGYNHYVLSVGGSGGADMINNTVLDLMKEYISKRPDVCFVHITGRNKYSDVSAKFSEMGLDKFRNLVLLDYTDDMPTYMAAADVVISRSGALTLSELALMGKATVLIPSPNVTNNHQFFNSKVLADKDAAILIEEKDLTVKRLFDEINGCLSDTKRKRELETNIKTFAFGDANERILGEILKLVDKKNKKI